MNLESPVKTLNKSQEEVYNFLMNIENFEKLMPENTKFEKISDTRFLFGLKGMPEIVLDLKEGIPHSKVVLGAASDKIPFQLTADIKELAVDKTEVQLHFEGEFNAMMAMMVKGPITKFIGTLSDNMDVIA
ncbi:orotate phosphoribosyltransferase [Dokdonia sp. Dokd-P16]|uniref:orotate phosphoribosyltransferase n=1 Tax=Dokdonia sp. Dokd-P16 TaxID=2173169 RepID=UPI000D548BCE|nr:orotate phosphoribosyltransferase [Dokdonia sp. Dokd-P16]AWH72984.1 orotate phosphoribosyltransferase [Dokdonia sp. Dokd-P16]